jgi:hypothetical protein
MPFIPEVLTDPVPGNIGLLGPARMLWSFAEPDGVMPTDAMGNLADMGPATVAPIAATAWTGKGRTFTRALSHGLVGADLPGKDTLIQRDVTIQALVSLTLAGASAGAKTLIARGLNDGSISERYAFGVELQEAGGSLVDVRMFWQDSAGVIQTQAAGQYQHPGDGAEFLLTVTRRWESSSSVIVRYYANETMIAEVTSTDGDISGGTTGGTSIGARKAAGTWQDFFSGTIDQLAVYDREVSHEEIRQTWRRLFVYQPAGVAMFSGLIPPGLRWNADPGNYSGRRVKLAGQALGLGVAAIEELRALFLPDAAAKDHIARWEKLTGLAPKPRDSLDRRRQRVMSFLAREENMAVPSILAALEESLDADAADLEMIEFTNTVSDSFETLETERWFVNPETGVAAGGIPTFVGMGTAASGVGALTDAAMIPAGVAAGDIMILAVNNTYSATTDATLSDAQGFAAIPGAAVNSGLFSGSIRSHITLFWKRATGADSPPTVADNGEFNVARIYAYRGCVAAGDPWDVAGVGADGDNDGDATMTMSAGATTAGANRLACVFVAGFTGGTASLAGWTNADLANIVERDDTNYLVVGDRVHLAHMTGEKAAAGAYGATTATWSGAAYYVGAAATIALKPTAASSAAWSIDANELRADAAAGTDVRWETQRLGHHVRTPLSVKDVRDEYGRIFVSAKLSSWTLQADAGVGLLLYNGRTASALWFGVYNNGGTVQLGYRRVVREVLGAWVPISTPWATAPVWLRAYTPQEAGGSRTAFNLAYSTVGPSAGFVNTALVFADDVDFEWAGFGVFGTSAALAGALTADFDDFLAYTPDGLRSFNWYVYRDPLLAGEPDVVGSRLLVEKLKPAHTHATTIQSRSVLCDNPEHGLCDRGPMGAL